MTDTLENELILPIAYLATSNQYLISRDNHWIYGDSYHHSINQLTYTRSI